MSTAVTSGTVPPGHGGDRSATSSRWWIVATVLELGLAATAVLLDLAIPSMAILVLMAISLLVRRKPLSTMGFHQVRNGWSLAAGMVAAAVGWTVLDAGLLKPLEYHLGGVRQDMSQWTSLEGDARLLLLWLALAWTVAALGETLAFIGFVQTRMAQLIGLTRLGLVLATLLTSVLLGLLHTEYGFVGVSISTVNGLFYCFLRYRFGSLWAPILAHGFIDTIGLVTVFLVGPVAGLW